ncbi:MAG: 2-hydroxychromene-2-carboxylate isomerase [Pseudomonadota bacterium]
MAHIDYYFACISPFTYLAGARMEEVAAKHGATITYKPVDLMQLFPRTGGLAPKDRHPARMEYRAQDLRRQSAMTGLALNMQPAHFPTNPAPSAYAVISAQKAGGGDLGKLVAYYTTACWAEDRDVADDAVIKAGLEAAGFDPSLSDSGMLTAADEYAANLEEAVSAGAFGAPFYIVGGEKFWGQDRIGELDMHLGSLA